MKKVFTFGKYLPFHKGHEALIRYALGIAEKVTVLVCCSDKELVAGQIRKSWIEESFKNNEDLDVMVIDYSEDILPNTSETSASVSAKWARYFLQICSGHDALITSEPYGEIVARYMGINHCLFDMERSRFPISASKIREDLWAHWQYLPNAVKQYYCIKVVLSGTESTGKSTLAAQLAGYFKCGLVEEAGREIIADSKDLCFDKLQEVAEAHAALIKSAIENQPQLLIIDTDIHITRSYASYFFNTDLKVALNIEEVNKADLYLYLNNDVEYEQDGTRLSLAERNELDKSHRKILMQNGITFLEISGTWSDRSSQAIAHVEQLIRSKRSQPFRSEI